MVEKLGAIAFIGRIFSLYLRIVLNTIRWRRVDEGGFKFVQNSERAVIIVSWHSRFLIHAMLHPSMNVAYLISPSFIGKIMFYLTKAYNIAIIWGSSNRKPVSSYMSMYRRLKMGKSICITPDVPRCPARMAAMGVVHLARASSSAIIPITWSASRMNRLQTWDMTAIPGFFSSGIGYWGKPIHVSSDANSQEME